MAFTRESLLNNKFITYSLTALHYGPCFKLILKRAADTACTWEENKAGDWEALVKGQTYRNVHNERAKEPSHPSGFFTDLQENVFSL